MEFTPIFCRYCYEPLHVKRSTKRFCSPACRANHSTLNEQIRSGKRIKIRSQVSLDATIFGALNEDIEGHLRKYGYTILDELSGKGNLYTQHQKQLQEMYESYQKQKQDYDALLGQLELVEKQIQGMNQPIAKHTSQQEEITTISQENSLLARATTILEQSLQDYQKVEERKRQLASLRVVHQQILSKEGPLREQINTLVHAHNQEKEKTNALQKEITSILQKLNRGDFSGLKHQMTIITPKGLQGLSQVMHASLSDHVPTQKTTKAKARRKRAIVPLAEKGLRKEGIVLGKALLDGRAVYFNPRVKEPVGLSNAHLMWLGTSGAGKSEGAASLLYEYSAQKVSFMVLDLDGTFSSNHHCNAKGIPFHKLTKAKIIDASQGVGFNPLALPASPVSGQRQNYQSVVYRISEMIGKIFGLGERQQAAFKRLLKRAYEKQGFSSDKKSWHNPAPTFPQILKLLEGQEKLSIFEEGVLDRLDPLFDEGLFTQQVNGSSFDHLLSENTIMDLSTLPTANLRVVLCQLILHSIYDYMFSKGPSATLRHVLFIDEAHKLAFDESLEKLFREARKYGIGIILASQSPKDFDPIVFDLVATKIVMALDGESAKTMAHHIGVTDKGEVDNIHKQILSFTPGQALLRNNHYSPYISLQLTPLFKK